MPVEYSSCASNIKKKVEYVNSLECIYLYDNSKFIIYVYEIVLRRVLL